MMPKLSGFELCKKLEGKENLGIILLTAKGDIVDKVVGLEPGADDYLTKPFDIRELVARVHALFRRLDKKGNKACKVIEFGELKPCLEP